jgi:hypothetical protein
MKYSEDILWNSKAKEWEGEEGWKDFNQERQYSS